MCHNSVTPDAFAKVIKVMNHTYIPRVLLTGFSTMTKDTAWESTVLDLPERWGFYSRNFLSNLVTVLGSTATSSFAQQIFWLIPWCYGSVWTRWACSQINVYYNFMHAAFKLHTKWSNTQRVSTLTTMTQPNTSDNSYGLNCFGHGAKYRKTFDSPS